MKNFTIFMVIFSNILHYFTKKLIDPLYKSFYQITNDKFKYSKKTIWKQKNLQQPMSNRSFFIPWLRKAQYEHAMGFLNPLGIAQKATLHIINVALNEKKSHVAPHELKEILCVLHWFAKKMNRYQRFLGSSLAGSGLKKLKGILPIWIIKQEIEAFYFSFYFPMPPTTLTLLSKCQNPKIYF